MSASSSAPGASSSTTTDSSISPELLLVAKQVIESKRRLAFMARLWSVPCAFLCTKVLPTMRTAWRLYYRVAFIVSLVFTIIYMVPSGECDDGIYNSDPAQQYIKMRSTGRAFLDTQFQIRHCDVPADVPARTFVERVALVIVPLVMSGELYDQYFWNGTVWSHLCQTKSDISTKFIVMVAMAVILSPIVTSADLVACAYCIGFGSRSASVVILLATAVLSLLLLSPFFSSSNKRVFVVHRSPPPAAVLPENKKDQ
jgi:hypothetical protein